METKLFWPGYISLNICEGIPSVLSTLSSLQQRLLKFLPFFMPALLALLPQTHHSAAQRHFYPGRQQELRSYWISKFFGWSAFAAWWSDSRLSIARAPGVFRWHLQGCVPKWPRRRCTCAMSPSQHRSWSSNSHHLKANNTLEALLGEVFLCKGQVHQKLCTNSQALCVDGFAKLSSACCRFMTQTSCS